MKIFKLNRVYSIVCTYENTSYGFRHLATLFKGGFEISKTKAVYYNRTWESYAFQSVMFNLIDGYDNLSTRQKTIFLNKIKGGF